MRDTFLAIKMDFRYQERGALSIKRCEETEYLYLDREPDTVREYQEHFEKQIRKAVAMFSKDKLYNCEMQLDFCKDFYSEERFALVSRLGDDEANDVYTLYKYGKQPQADVVKVSKAALIKELIRMEREKADMLLGIGVEATA